MERMHKKYDFFTGNSKILNKDINNTYQEAQ